MESEPAPESQVSSNDLGDKEAQDVETEAEIVAELVPTAEHETGKVNPQPTARHSNSYEPTVLIAPPPRATNVAPPQIANLAAKGGAVGSMVLGVLAFAGSFISSYAIVNSGLGIAMGLWGLTSSRRRLATAGLILCTISAFFCVLEISTWLNTVWPSEEI